MKIKIKINDSALMPSIIKKGDWIDLKTASNINLKGPSLNNNNEILFYPYLIDLGIAMKLPEGFEAVVLPRSSTFKNYWIMLGNSQGVIDNSYNGNYDMWKFYAVPFANISVPIYSRIAQFRIQLSQKATFWHKLKWLLSSKIELVKVDDLGDNNRGGFGSTGK